MIKINTKGTYFHYCFKQKFKIRSFFFYRKYFFKLVSCTFEKNISPVKRCLIFQSFPLSNRCQHINVIKRTYNTWHILHVIHVIWTSNYVQFKSYANLVLVLERYSQLLLDCKPEALCGKCLCSQFFWSVFSRIWTEDTPYLSVFSPNAGKYGPEKLRIRKSFTHWRKFPL